MKKDYGQITVHTQKDETTLDYSKEKKNDKSRHGQLTNNLSH